MSTYTPARAVCQDKHFIGDGWYLSGDPAWPAGQSGVMWRHPGPVKRSMDMQTLRWYWTYVCDDCGRAWVADVDIPGLVPPLLRRESRRERRQRTRALTEAETHRWESKKETR